ncbi:hypothetical protein DEJ50_22810 [Streptomyces venezuelae]|uniref:Uncharacterized protein n=1 Tax=Streptomyces venezuelae TaxID=54571 RepID=A0A5P2D503_STRVZ|nr:hypothetical protein DEJ50_22810 [Streptomyces venezuelae]
MPRARSAVGAGAAARPVTPVTPAPPVTPVTPAPPVTPVTVTAEPGVNPAAVTFTLAPGLPWAAPRATYRRLAVGSGGVAVRRTETGVGPAGVQGVSSTAGRPASRE